MSAQEPIVFLVEERESTTARLILLLFIVLLILAALGIERLQRSLEEEPAFCKVLPWPLRIGCDLIWGFWARIL